MPPTTTWMHGCLFCAGGGTFEVAGACQVPIDVHRDGKKSICDNNDACGRKTDGLVFLHNGHGDVNMCTDLSAIHSKHRNQIKNVHLIPVDYVAAV